MLWGNSAKHKLKFITTNKHLILLSSHPSPFSANKGFFGCKHFSKTNAFLQNHKIKMIDWKII